MSGTAVRRWWIPLVLALLVPGGCGGGERPIAVAPTPAPRVSIVGLDPAGVREELGRHRGRVTFVNVWASWCRPCRAEFAELELFHRAHHDGGIDVVAISVDDEAVRDTALRQFLEERPATFTVVHTPGRIEALKAVLDPTWSGEIPTTFVLDRRGGLLRRLDGPQKHASLDDAAAAALPGLQPCDQASTE